MTLHNLSRTRFFLFLIFSFSFLISAGAQTWSGVGSGAKGSFTPMCVHNGKLYVGGMDSVGKKATHLASWDGKMWASPDSDFQGSITAMVEYNGKLYAGTEIGTGNSASYNLLRWNDTLWKYVGSANGRINALYVMKGELYIGGSFTKADTVAAKHIVKYSDSAGWHKVGHGLPNNVWALIVFREMLYAGGQFESVERLNGKSWEDVMSSGQQYKTGWVKGFTNYFDELYACGEFNYLLKWNSQAWSPVGPFNDGASAMAFYDNGLFVGGGFTSVPGVDNVFHITNYQNSTRAWSCMGGVIYWAGDCKTYTGTVSSLAVYKNELYVGGQFMIAGGKFASNIAKWTVPMENK
ncbi:MAG TPA: hypothetical protein VK808_13490 [Bacteroidia bacterium]|nr:hypothetical protein [Bacteroidia bacterium]